jgi:hypothetical protein
MAYGWDTRSWRHSSEKRAIDRQCREARDRYEIKPESVVCEWGMCTCSEKRFPHEPHRNELDLFQLHCAMGKQ